VKIEAIIGLRKKMTEFVKPVIEYFFSAIPEIIRLASITSPNDIDIPDRMFDPMNNL